MNPTGVVVAVVWLNAAVESAAMQSAKAAARGRRLEVVVFMGDVGRCSLAVGLRASLEKGRGSGEKNYRSLSQ